MNLVKYSCRLVESYYHPRKDTKFSRKNLVEIRED